MRLRFGWHVVASAAVAVLFWGLPGAALAQTETDIAVRDIGQEEQLDELRMIALRERPGPGPVVAVATDDLHAGGNPYKVGLSVNGTYNPSIRPGETWIHFACFSEPSRRHTGFGLVRVDLRLYYRRRVVLDTADYGLRLDGTNGTSVCSIDRGVDSSFFDVDRSLRFDNWSIYITTAEKHRKGIETGRPWSYRRLRCPEDADRCRSHLVREHGPVYRYGGER